MQNRKQELLEKIELYKATIKRLANEVDEDKTKKDFRLRKRHLNVAMIGLEHYTKQLQKEIK